MATQMDWDPIQFFRSDYSPLNPFAILILNQPINGSALSILRRHACFVVCADGGANRFYDLMKKNGGKESIDLPNAIVGDLDSIKPAVKQHYQNCGVPVIHNSDQESTDFTKCVEYLRANASKIIASSPSQAQTQVQQNHLDILIFGGLGGRVDQAFSQIHHLYTASQQDLTSTTNDGELYLISEESISFVLRRGRNTIRTTTAPTTTTKPSGNHSTTTARPQNGNQTSYLEENIGILPVGVSSVISTEGLEWDVKDWKTEIGGRVSTSNHIRAEVIAVETTEPVLFTAELAGRFKIGGSG
ncbi:hypothetical protein FQN54_004212 [Arachnomyces sp. PD_36]|nr:hypothetical protein FQN54_004212 [Arachnomyces sp. PD_36]